MEPIRNLMKHLLSKSVGRRRAFFILSDILLISVAMYASFWMRFDGQIPAEYSRALFYFILLALICKLLFLVLYNLYDISWSLIGLDELTRGFTALSFGSLALGMALYFLRTIPLFSTTPFPRSILIIDYVLSLILIGSLRVSKRAIQQGLKGLLRPKGGVRKTLIIGAGSAGEQIVREMKRNGSSAYWPIGFIDDDPIKKSIKMHGVKVLGNRAIIPDILGKNGVEDVLIAIPSSKSKDIREIAQIVRESGFKEKMKILPSTNDLIDGNVTLADIQEIKLTDLLGREPTNIDHEVIKSFIQGKKVLITGAGGSIGSEIVKSVLSFKPETILIFDIDETELFDLMDEIESSHSRIVPIVGDIKDGLKMDAVFKQYFPDIVLHAAAYKHVPILEFFPEEALKTNLMGTKVVAEASMKHNVDKFIFISTDKAINPTSIMGASKRASEEMLKAFNQKSSTRFISVRFGNVLGSRGSVIPRFKKQISQGGPVTVTHPDMKRYFMITSEAVLLVLEAGAIGDGGEVFVLDMGEQVKIVDLAREMISLSTGNNDVEIPIIFTQIRPGEKLYEEVIGAEEGVEATAYEKLLVARDSNHRNLDMLLEKINRLIELSMNGGRKEEMMLRLWEIIPTYNPSKEEGTEIFW